MIRIIRLELNISPILKKKIIWASKYTNINITIENGAFTSIKDEDTLYTELDANSDKLTELLSSGQIT